VINSEKNKTMQSERNKLLKVISSYKFRFNKFLINDVERWCCTVKTCKCFAKLIVKSLIIYYSLIIDTEIEIFDEHNHKPLPENILTRQKIGNNLKRKAVDDMFIRPSKILQYKICNFKY